MSFNTKLKKLREQYGLSQSDIATKLNVTQSAVGNWESGTREPNFNTLIMMARFFDVTVDELLDYGNEPKTDLDLNLMKIEKLVMRMEELQKEKVIAYCMGLLNS